MSEANDARAEILDALGGDTYNRGDREITVKEITDHVRWLEDRAKIQALRLEFNAAAGGYGDALAEVAGEIVKARKRFAPFNSAHEGYAVMLEELDELWDEIKAQNNERSRDKLRNEAKQVAAMAVAFMVDVCEGDFRK